MKEISLGHSEGKLDHSHRSIMGKEEGQEMINIRPTSISSMPALSKTALNWYFPVFDQIGEMHQNPSRSPGREMALGLHKLGFGAFVQDAWKWQHEALCEDFARNFDHAKMTTLAFGTEVDLSLETFVRLTGLSSEEGDELYPEEEPCLEDFASSWKKLFSSDSYDARSKGFALSKCKDSNVRQLIELLNDTAWMRILPRKYKHASKHLVYLICQSMEMKKRVNWGKTIHRKFMDELARLYMILFSNKKEKPTTRAGPLMCFLFAQFMDPVRHPIEGSSDDFSDPLCWEHPANSQDKMFRESAELLAEEKWDEERESRSSWEEVQMGTEPSTTGAIVLEMEQKGCLSTAVDKFMRLVESQPPRKKGDSTFAELYIEEQKHAEECLKAKLAAERTSESLRAELKEIRKRQQHSSAACVEEQFAKHQVAVLRQRLERNILERDQARAENKYLKMQLREITLQFKNQQHL